MLAPDGYVSGMMHTGNSMKEVRHNAVASLHVNQKGVLSNDMQKKTASSGLNYLYQLLCHHCSERDDICYALRHHKIANVT